MSMSKLSRTAIILGGGLLVAQSVVSELSRSSSDDRYNTAAYIPHYQQAEKTQVLHTEMFQEHPGATQVDYDVAGALRDEQQQTPEMMVPKGRLLGDHRTVSGGSRAHLAQTQLRPRLVRLQPMLDPAPNRIASAPKNGGEVIPIVEEPQRPRRGIKGFFSRVASGIHQKWVALRNRNQSAAD